jgi:hypothetical protein
MRDELFDLTSKHLMARMLMTKRKPASVGEILTQELGP